MPLAAWCVVSVSAGAAAAALGVVEWRMVRRGSMGGGSGKSGGVSEDRGRYIVHTRYIARSV